MKKYPVPAVILKDLKRVERAITEALADREGQLKEPAAHTVRAGGKRLRPALTLIAGQAGDYDYDKIETVAVAIELLHTATLVHDDVMDGAGIRRGLPTVNGRWNDIVAVATGNFLFARSFYVLCGKSASGVMPGLTFTALELSRGETMQQQALRDVDLSIEEYTERVRAKTASLFSACCGYGALAAGAGSDEVEALKRYGECLGLAFQIYDDVLDFTADESVLGKPVGADIRDGTVTLPVIYALRDDPSGKVREVMTCAEPTEADVGMVLELVNGNGAIDRAKTDAAAYIEKACRAVAAIGNTSLKKELTDIGEFVINRYN